MQTLSNRKSLSIVLLIPAFLLASMVSAQLTSEAPAIREVPGYVTHGVNVFNDEYLTDYSEASPKVFWLMPVPPIMEMGVFDPEEGASDAARINANTDLDLPVATIRSFADEFNPGGVFDPTIFNRPFDEIGTLAFGYTDVTQRVIPVDFEKGRPQDIYEGAGTLFRPTVRDWNAASGLFRYRCRPDGTAEVRLAVRDAIPNAVYTLWDVGALNPLTEEEDGYAAPFGGLPNILLTDAEGCGYKRLEVPYCPGRPCEAGADSCTSYVSAFLHWDNQVYGGAPAATFAGMPIGAVGSNHVMWPMSGTPMQDPHNDFPDSDLRCPE